MNCNISFISRALRVGVLLAAVLLQGCYPDFERFDRSATYHGRIVDVDTSSPVENAILKINIGSLRASAKSGKDGFFRLGPIHELRFGIMTLEGLRPESSSGWPSTINLSISRAGYRSLRFNVPADTLTWESPLKTNDWSEEVELGDIKLQGEHKN